MGMLKKKNFAKSVLNSGIAIGASQLTVPTGEGSLFPSGGEFMAVLWGAGYVSPLDDTTREIIRMDLNASDTFDITRAQEGTSAKAWSANDNIAHIITAGTTPISLGKALFKDVKSTTTQGGSASATTWNIRVLNTTDYNDITGCSLSSNQITLAAGTYRISARVPAYNTNEHKGALYNVTDTSYDIIGSCARSSSNSSDQTESFVHGELTITAQKTFELRHYTTTSRTTYGLGLSVDDGSDEVYSTIEIERVA